jgi:ribonucleoside-diphosphate reductase alpha chain
MNNPLSVTKRNGEKESIDLDKIHKVITWAAQDLNNVSVSQVEIKAHIQFYDGIRTDEIHETLIKSAADLISTEAPDYQYLAARLAIFHLRKKAYGQFTPPHLYEHVTKLVGMGKYDEHLLANSVAVFLSKRMIVLIQSTRLHQQSLNTFHKELGSV